MPAFLCFQLPGHLLRLASQQNLGLSTLTVTHLSVVQEARAQLVIATVQPISLQISVADDSSRPVTAVVTPAKPFAGLQHTGEMCSPASNSTWVAFVPCT